MRNSCNIFQGKFDILFTINPQVWILLWFMPVGIWNKGINFPHCGFMLMCIRANLVYVGSVTHSIFPTTKRTLNICNASKNMCTKRRRKKKGSQNIVHGIGIYHQIVSLCIPLQEFHFKAVLYLQQFPSPKVSILLLTPKNCSQVLSGVISVF